MSKKSKFKYLKNANEIESELNLNEKQKDYLKELGNIGWGHAISSLSFLLNEPIKLSLTDVKVIPFWELPNVLGGPGVEVFAIFSKGKGEPNLSFLQFYTKESIINLLNFFSDKDKKIQKLDTLEDLDESAIDTITEIGNIIAGNYVSALANLLSIKLILDVPDLIFDYIGAIADGLIAKYSEYTNSIILITTDACIQKLNLNGVFCFFPSLNNLEGLFKPLNE